MQFIVISHQLYEIFLGILIGLAFGGVYDLLRFLRRFFKNVTLQMIFANFLDIVFSIFAGTVYCIYIYYASNGRFRWFTVFAVIVGYCIYIVCPSKVIRPLLYFIADKVCVLFSVLFRPFVSLIRCVVDRYLYIRNKLRFNNQKTFTENLKLQLCDYVKL